MDTVFLIGIPAAMKSPTEIPKDYVAVIFHECSSVIFTGVGKSSVRVSTRASRPCKQIM